MFSAIAGMLWVGGSDVIKGEMSAGNLGAFVFYAIMVASSMATISEVLGELQRAAGATERLVEILQVESDISAPSNHKDIDTNMPAEVVFKGVDFNYPSRPNQPAIKGLDLTAEQGKVLALVGPSGAGKTTLFELLQRFYDPQQGQVLFAGEDVRQFDKRPSQADGPSPATASLVQSRCVSQYSLRKP
ncbi:ABC-type multidrug transport system [Vibrio ishigakensis]|uniref:ABC-type multidrug transport system n=1 Tax=Vibrio ishigakensis TaxID=1481914 RepID=A0A0B8NNS3_9VIBR|nr:ABC-type multidrug transport system [Vibrio ishigakensis]